MRILATIIFLILNSTILSAQEKSPRYRLSVGEQYYMSQELSQVTQTEEGNLIGNISLDISNTLELDVSDVTAAGNYILDCRYTALELDFFAPQSDIAISSSSSAFSPIKTYLNMLKGSPFTVLMSKHGEFLEIMGLDSTINALSTQPDQETGDRDTGEHKAGDVSPGAVKKKGYEDGETGALIKKTIGDAFGAAALKSMANTALHFYDDTAASTCVKKTEVLFSGRPIEITNNFYYNKIQDHSLRVQGVGVIRETTARIELNEFVLVTSLKGNQTYDFLCDLRTGWPKEGMSKQKIHSLSGIRDHDELPEGLKIPSVTETEFSFTGGKRYE